MFYVFQCSMTAFQSKLEIGASNEHIEFRREYCSLSLRSKYINGWMWWSVCFVFWRSSNKIKHLETINNIYKRNSIWLVTPSIFCCKEEITKIQTLEQNNIHFRVLCTVKEASSQAKYMYNQNELKYFQKLLMQHKLLSKCMYTI